MNYGYQRTVDLSFAESEERLHKVLQDQGFGVLTEIDVKSTMKEKLNEDYPLYKILGACNPPIAHKMLSEEKGIGLLLPCNVVLWDNENGTTTIATINAEKMIKLIDREDLLPLAQSVNELLCNAIDAV